MKINKRYFTFLVTISATIVFIYIYKISIKNNAKSIFNEKAINKNSLIKNHEKNNLITLAVVACGQRLTETLTLIKSAILFNQGKFPLQFIIVSEDNLRDSFTEKLSDWQEIKRGEFIYKILPLKFPKENVNEWKSLFKPCAAQRLFLPSLLHDVDSVLYMDTDTLFLSPINEIWEFFNEFNSSQIAGLSPEHEDKNVGWYNRFARHPFYGPLGINSGVMLMNLTRMREFQWEKHILPIHEEYKLRITWGDQDLINILFYYHPDKLFVFPCEFNYRPDHCMYTSVCNASHGVRIIHGNRGYFHNEKQPIFNILYQALESYQFENDPYKDFLLPLTEYLKDNSVKNSNCGKVVDKLLIKTKNTFLEKTYNS